MTLQRSSFAARLSPPLSYLCNVKVLPASLGSWGVSCLWLSSFLFQHLRRALTLSLSPSYSARRCLEGEVHRCLGGVGHTQASVSPGATLLPSRAVAAAGEGGSTPALDSQSPTRTTPRSPCNPWEEVAWGSRKRNRETLSLSL